MILPTEFHIWIAIAFLAAGMISYAWEKVSLEITSLVLVVGLLLWFQVFPLLGPDSTPLLTPQRLLAGFANPTLIAVLSLIVMGQGIVQTGALNALVGLVVQSARRRRALVLGGSLIFVAIVSAFLNNTPVVVIFIPILQTLAQRMRLSAGQIMMPLSFAAILGGMTTLIGSSTNLLVSGAMANLGFEPLSIFSVTGIGAVLALVGLVYVLLVMPRLLPHRGSLADSLRSGGRQFIAEIIVRRDDPLWHEEAVAGRFKSLPDVTVQLIQRGQRTILPPFADIRLEADDVLIVAATTSALTEALQRHAGFLLAGGEPDGDNPAQPIGRARSDHVLAEVMITPASRMVDLSIDMVGFQRRFDCLVLGVQRRGRMTRQRMGDIRLAAGDVLLLAGPRENVARLRANPDLLLMMWAVRDMPRPMRAPMALAIFAITVVTMTAGLLPISVAAPAGAVAMVLSGCLNLRQASRSIDRTVFLLVGATLALGEVLQVTGAASLIAGAVAAWVGGEAPLLAIAALFLVVAIATNMLSNNACAVLFTPIAVNLGIALDIDPMVMALTVLFAANCSFATPIGYQTNLLVMGPGHYRFRDFIRAGLPLAILVWLTFVAVLPVFVDL
ncbi:MAG: SLC13 family permease [Azospirillaceae bacterium]